MIVLLEKLMFALKAMQAYFETSLAEISKPSDWKQTDSKAIDYIKNKPDIPKIDATLSISGQAGDAKAIRDAIDNIEFPEIPENVVQYTEQNLTEEHKMQARKNLGLYYYEYPIILNEEINTDSTFSKYVCKIDDLSLADYMDLDGLHGFRVKLYAVSSGFDIVYETQLCASHNIPMQQDIYYIGNSDMHHLLNDQNDNIDWPFLIYTNLYYDSSSDYETYINFEEGRLAKKDRDGKYTLTVYAITDDSYIKIPEEYLPKMVKYTEQTLTDEQKLQVRANIDAAGAIMIVNTDYNSTPHPETGAYKADHTFEEIKAWYDAGGIVYFSSVAHKKVLCVKSTYIDFVGFAMDANNVAFSKTRIDKDGYITTTIQHLNGKVSYPETASVGQVLAISGIGGNGKPNACEAIDLPTKVSAFENDSGFATEEYVDNSIIEAKSYTDTAVAALVNSAPETLDTLGELATAFEENADMVATLDAAVTNKAEKTDLESAQDLIEANANNISSIQTALNKYSTETWTFTLDNGSTVTKKMVISS